jgi:hypothetical protein
MIVISLDESIQQDIQINQFNHTNVRPQSSPFTCITAIPKRPTQHIFWTRSRKENKGTGWLQYPMNTGDNISYGIVVAFADIVRMYISQGTMQCIQ